MDAEKMRAEAKAINEITEILLTLEPDSVTNILEYFRKQFQVRPPRQGVPAASEIEIRSEETVKFDSFDELFDAARPVTSVDKALVAAYWFQVVQGYEDLEGFQLNRELKNLGHQSNNITRDLESLRNREPRYLNQIRKEGSTKQARKRYKLTREGIRAVERLLRQQTQSEDGQLES